MIGGRKGKAPKKNRMKILDRERKERREGREGRRRRRRKRREGKGEVEGEDSMSSPKKCELAHTSIFLFFFNRQP